MPLWFSGTGKTTLAMVIANTTKVESVAAQRHNGGARRTWKRLWKRQEYQGYVWQTDYNCSSMRSTDSTSHSRIISRHLLRTIEAP